MHYTIFNNFVTRQLIVTQYVNNHKKLNWIKSEKALPHQQITRAKTH